MRQWALVVAVCVLVPSLFAAQAEIAPRRDSVVRLSPAAMQAAIDPATGRLRQMTPEEARELARSFMASLKLRPPVIRTLASGAVSATLDDSYQNFYLGRLTPEGDVQFDCVNDPQQAVAVLTAPAPTIMRRVSAQQPMEEK